MFRCWNCEHLMRVYSVNPRKGKLFENEFRKCKVKGIIFEHYSDITKERECKDYKESKHKIKYKEIADLKKTDISCRLREHCEGNHYDLSFFVRRNLIAYMQIDIDL